MSLPPQEKYGAFDHLEGETLAAVTFIWEYYQFLIGTSTLSIYSHPEVRTNSERFSQSSLKFRDALCDLIGARVVGVVDTDAELLFTFNNGRSLHISLLRKDRVSHGPESVVASNPEGNLIVIGDS